MGQIPEENGAGSSPRAGTRSVSGSVLEAPGFLRVHHATRVDPCDTEGVDRLCPYLVHPPVALGLLQ